MTELRHLVAASSRAAGLAGDRLDDFVVAVNELLTNAVRHGGGSGRLTLGLDGGAVVCAVSDAGPGLSRPWPEGHRRPSTHSPGGWGLWLAAELTDRFELETGTDGTTATISTSVSSREP